MSMIDTLATTAIIVYHVFYVFYRHRKRTSWELGYISYRMKIVIFHNESTVFYFRIPNRKQILKKFRRHVSGAFSFPGSS